MELGLQSHQIIFSAINSEIMKRD